MGISNRCVVTLNPWLDDGNRYVDRVPLTLSETRTMFQRTATTAITSPSSTDVIPSMGFHGNYNGYNYPYDSSESCTDEYRDAMS